MGQTKTKVIGESLEKKPRKKEAESGSGEAEKEKNISKSAKPVRHGKKTRGARYREAAAKVDKSLYSTEDAVKLVKETSTTSFDGSVELHIVSKKEKVKERLTLAHSTGKAKRVEVAEEETIKKIESGKIDFDILLATPEMMPRLVPFAKVLGPRGLMPNPKNGTVIKDPKEAEKFSGNAVTVQTEPKAPLIHLTVGKVSFNDSWLVENVEAVLRAVGKNQITKAYLASTMGPSVRLSISE